MKSANKTGHKPVVLVTGGAGYVGCVLVHLLVRHGFRVRVLDLFLFDNRHVFDGMKQPGMAVIEGDIRDGGTVRRALRGVDHVIHLAALSNDPCSELDPDLTEQINLAASVSLMQAAKKAGVHRFVFASSATVYGVKDEPRITEESVPAPITLYGRFKHECERHLLELSGNGFHGVVLRPATVCGFSPRMRFDLTVNIFVKQAVTTGSVRVHGGAQMRPNVHIDDLTEAYLLMLEAPDGMVAGKIFNVGFENLSVMEIASAVREAVGNGVGLEQVEVFDHRSYRLDSTKIEEQLGFRRRLGIMDAAREVAAAIRTGAITAPDDSRYVNIAYLKEKGYKRLCRE
ncbi:NAD-dependent epimerase/dehydratase [bacterium]|nr:NAD-dependent epimerase/dehydratase [candidate division CSSED10-310 bacterium]